MTTWMVLGVQVRHFLATRRCRWLVGAAVLLPVVAAVVCVAWPRTGLPQRVANQTVQMPLAPPTGTAWTTENAFPELKFFEPTCIVPAGDGSGRVFVLERRGTVQMFANDRATRRKHQVLDFSDRVLRTPYDDDGAVGLVLHPEFGQAGSPNRHFCYVLYTARVGSDRYNRLSRFRLPEGRAAADPDSERVLIDQYNRDPWHNGGGLAFGPDGFLYIGTGDEGTDGDSLGNGQRIDRSLFSGILRIDVDRRGGQVSRPPGRQPKRGRTDHYFVPRDNPFVGVPGALEEFWAIGLRNPYRISFDQETGQLWASDVGHLLREEINLVTRGSNHQWSYAEGNLAFGDSYLRGKKPEPYYGVETPPLYEYPHVNGNNCIIGGHVYRGSRYAELTGKYIYADNGSGRVWALEYDGQQVVSNVELTALPVSSKTGISSLGEDADGELWIVVLGEGNQVDGTIHRLVPAASDRQPTLPQRLSQTGLFADLQTLTPSPGLMPYSVNTPFWSDGALKRRWILLPGDGSDPQAEFDRIRFSPTGPWQFPAGTILVKHFDLPLDETDLSVLRRLETRVLVRHGGQGVYGVTYRWNRAGTDAELVEDDLHQRLTLRTADGTRTQTWHYPSPQTCLACHTENAQYVLGVNAVQLHGNHRYQPHGVVRNQLREWNRIGMFTRRLEKREIEAVVPLASAHDPEQDIDRRARSYLEANCAYCHQPGGVRGNFDARYETSLETLLAQRPGQGAFNIPDPRIVTPGDPFRSVLYYRLVKRGEGHMPPLSPGPIDRDGLQLLYQWICQLPAPPQSRAGNTAELGPYIDARAQVQWLRGAGAAAEEDRARTINELLGCTSSALTLWQALYEDRLPEPVRSQALAQGRAHPEPTVRDLFTALPY